MIRNHLDFGQSRFNQSCHVIVYDCNIVFFRVQCILKQEIQRTHSVTYPGNPYGKTNIKAEGGFLGSNNLEM